MHDLFPITNPEWFSHRYAKLASALLRRGLDRADAFVAVSDPVSAQIASLGWSQPVVVAPNAAAAVFAPVPNAREKIASRFPEIGNEEFFLTFGSGDNRKGLDVVVEASRQAGLDAKLVLVGGGNSTVLGKDRSRDLNACRVGRVTDSDLALLYSGCRAFISASQAEGFGLPLVEAASCGAYVIASDIPIHHWSLGPEADMATFFPVGDSMQLAIVMTAIASSDRSPAGLSKDSRFSWDSSARVVEKLLRLLNQRA